MQKFGRMKAVLVAMGAIVMTPGFALAQAESVTVTGMDMQAIFDATLGSNIGKIMAGLAAFAAVTIGFAFAKAMIGKGKAGAKGQG